MSFLVATNTNKYFGCPFCPNNRESENISKNSTHSRNEVPVFFETQSRSATNVPMEITSSTVFVKYIVTETATRGRYFRSDT